MNTETPEIKFSDVQTQAEIVYSSGDSVMILLGSGGTGKTALANASVTKAIAKLYGVTDETVKVYKCNYTGASPLEITGYGVLKKGANGEDLMSFSEPEGIPTAALLERLGMEDTPCLLVFDEMPEWAADTRSLVRSTVDPDGESKIGSHRLGENVKILVTGNRREDGSRSAVLDAPIVNRGNQFILKADINSWLSWASEFAWSKFSPVVEYLQFNAKLESGNHFAPPIPQPWDGSPHPTPRSWASAARQINYIENNLELSKSEFNKHLKLTLQSKVGDTTARDCIAYITSSSGLLDDLDAVRKGTMKLSHKPTDQFKMIHAALRIMDIELTQAEQRGRDRGTAVSAGDVDWFVENLLLPATKEIGRAGYHAAINVDIPLNEHPKNHELKGL